MKKETQSLKNANRKSIEFSYTALLIFGTFGAHQFYLSNKKKGLYLLATAGISQFLLFTSMKQSMFYGPSSLNDNIILWIAITGAVLGAPVWIWDLFTLHKQVRKINNENGLETQNNVFPSITEIIERRPQ